jgi:hypothetical protein
MGDYIRFASSRVLGCFRKQFESGRGQPHSKTSRTELQAIQRASVWECGRPRPLFSCREMAQVGIRFQVFGFWQRERRTRFGHPGVVCGRG